ncbi:hypothetical protein A3F19_03370 [Candidatus Nomurabacteria bacterium RIFCSPHIGHO2_12_FULL_37_29]|uniref:Uncharacterized protein n=2 Tax=Candidatus Nomuraibacteriota TaxID=1752729 RepID=A0A1F6Y760_9BACT|nr:MAG: hypothetical protein A3F19_03370 [Candidatus Nomurabacteria bacterium RIFCSPHIGHO2_12_FULL_37_29]OGJ02208.1 MAG: hypothetical protein A3G98_02140 [Candidatus Nomurabacteria bacterium RIFCSPLOWO2_12_FULL_37_8]
MDLFSTKVAHADFDSFLTNINSMIVNPLIKFIFAVTVVYFLYGVFEFLSNQENEEKKTSGKNHMLWGIIGITIMMGVWFFLNLIISTFNIEGINPEQGTVVLPTYNPPSR